jgi:twitching motility protein PilT
MQSQARSALAETLVGVICQRLVKRPYSGRRAAIEVLVATPGVQSIIRQSKTHLLPNAIATGRRHGMQTFAQHVEELIAGGEVVAEEARRFANLATAAA